MERKYSVNKPILIAGLSYLVLLVLFFIAKNFFPMVDGDWNDPWLADSICCIGAGICISIISIGYTSYAWKLDAQSFFEWYIAQQIIGKDWIRKFYNPESAFWSFRLIGPIGCLLGMAIIGLGIFSLSW